MRGPQGYGGPVAHWWQNCLSFTGAALDWRYEGIIHGYLHLYRHSGDVAWLARARRAGDDLLRGQLPAGTYRHSAFELNPGTGGTPHEAACDLALLSLSRVLRQAGDPGWRTYLAAAERNLRGYYIATLWDEDAHSFRDQPRIPSFVPNKAATLLEALLLWAELSGAEEPAERYARPAAAAILGHQERAGALDGAISQYSMRGEQTPRYLPYYIARCVPGLLAAYERWREEALLDAAQRAMAFVLRWRYEDGSFPQVVYPGGRVNRYPQWVAPVGDILRAMALLQPYGLETDADPEPTRQWLERGQLPTGAFRTAYGFGSQITQREPGSLPEFRDLLPVCGWVDKAFRYLAEQRAASSEQQAARSGPQRALPTEDHASRITPYEAECSLRGARCIYREDAQAIELRRGGELLYRWCKGADWAEACATELLWK